MNTTAWTYQAVVFFVRPLSKCELRSAILMMVMSSFGFFSAAVFAEPSVAKIEEVSCLDHQGKDLRSSDEDPRSPTQDQPRDHRRDSGESINLTGTVIRLPFRHI